MSERWRDDLPPLPERDLYGKVVSGGRARLARKRERRNTVLGVAAGVAVFAGLAGLIASVAGGGDDDSATSATTGGTATTTAGAQTSAAASTASPAETTTTAAGAGEPVRLDPSVVFEQPAAGASCGVEQVVVDFVPPIAVVSATVTWTAGLATGEAPMTPSPLGFTVTIGPFPADAAATGAEVSLEVTVKAVDASGATTTDTAEGAVRDCSP